MRWLFLFVLSLNLAYIGWQMSKSPSDDYEDVLPLKNVQRIVLLSELEPQQEDPAEAEQLDGKTETAAIDEIPNEQLPAKQAGPEQAAEKSQEVAEIAPQTEKNVVVQADMKAGQAEVVAVAEKPVSAEPLVTSAPAKPAPVKPAPAKPASAKPQQQTGCYTLGPFRDLIKLSALTREIKSYVVSADFRGREEKEQTLYWVYVKPEKTRKSAVATGKRLKAKKIKDFYIIRDGEKINGLSLGHFRSKGGAYGLAKKVRKLGFDVIVEPVFKTYTVYWLDYQLAKGAVIPEKIFETYLKSTKKDKISRLSRDCD